MTTRKFNVYYSGSALLCRSALAYSLAAAVALLPLPVAACGYEDPNSIATGALNFAYPNALHVGTAVWQAQQEGILPQHELADPAGHHDHDNEHEPKNAAAEVTLLLERLHRRLDTRKGEVSFALVLIRSMLWTRYTPSPKHVSVQHHSDGPENADVVLVSEAVVLRALLDGKLDVDTAVARGLLRTYGEDIARGRLRDWLGRALATPEAG